MSASPLAALTYAALTLVVTGCAFGESAMRPVDVGELSVRPPRMMVAEKISAPLLIVLDPRDVPDEVLVERDGVKPVRVTNLRAFVREDLRRAMLGYFDVVEVVSPGRAGATRGAHVLGRVRVQRLEMFVAEEQGAPRVLGGMQWSFALLVPGEDEFTFSWAGTSRGSYGLTDVRETSQMVESTLSAAITQMLEGYIARKVQRTLRAQVERAREQIYVPTGPPSYVRDI